MTSFASYTTSGESPDSESSMKFEEDDALSLEDDERAGSGASDNTQSASTRHFDRSRHRRRPSNRVEFRADSPTSKRHRRTPHRLVERHYREGLNSRFDALRDAVPAPSRMKTTKAGVLAAAINHIQHLETVNADLQNQLHAMNPQYAVGMEGGPVQQMGFVGSNDPRLLRTQSHPMLFHSHSYDASMASTAANGPGGGGYGFVHSYVST